MKPLFVLFLICPLLVFGQSTVQTNEFTLQNGKKIIGTATWTPGGNIKITSSTGISNYKFTDFSPKTVGVLVARNALAILSTNGATGFLIQSQNNIVDYVRLQGTEVQIASVSPPEGQMLVVKDATNFLAKLMSGPLKSKEELRLDRLNELLGKWHDKDRVATIGESGKLYSVSIVARDNLTVGLMESSFWRDSWSIFQVVYSEFGISKDVEVVAAFPVTDKYGKTAWKIVGEILLKRKEYLKINPKDFLPQNLPQIGIGHFSMD